MTSSTHISSTGSVHAPAPDPLLTAQDLADYLAKPISWVYHHSHVLPGYRIGRGLRFRRSDVETWLETRREGAPPTRRG